MSMQVYNAVGRRKSAVARVYLQDGKGNVTINGRDLKEYFPSELLQYVVNQPLETLNVVGNYDIKVTLDGGGVTGQAEAVRLGIARALVELNPENKPALRTAGFMTRDPREVERKKPGQPKARKRFQFSKR
ncbi:30S ribosomal protein S9 [anaerobic digester metagenome]